MLQINPKKEYGDYQTPLNFAQEVLEYSLDNFDINPDLIIEPTCGIGNFIKASKKYFPKTPIVAIDVNSEYIKMINEGYDNVKTYNEDIFKYDFNKILKNNINEYLIIGNPPWITNTDLSKLKSDNTPIKINLKKYGQFEAKTGMSNFDISENIILHIIEIFKNLNSTIIFLCKYNIACNIFEYLIKTSTYPAGINIVKFNAMKIFSIDASSCILILQFNENNGKRNTCIVKDLSNPNKMYKIGMKNDKLYSNIDNTIDIDGKCCYEWRQGIKHDCTKVMELKKEDGKYKNKKGEHIQLEEDLLYPLIKSSNIKKAIITKSKQKIIITQHKLREDTSHIKEEYPFTWKYLYKNKEMFKKRKSSIYKGAPDFSIFSVGDYSFKKYKVAISGFYKRGLFSLIYGEKTFMLDDTCYYISFDEYDEAYITMLILNSNIVQNFLKNIVFLDSKRPYTKKILKRIDIKKTLNLLSLEDLKETENMLKIDNYVTKDKFRKYVKMQ